MGPSPARDGRRQGGTTTTQADSSEPREADVDAMTEAAAGGRPALKVQIDLACGCRIGPGKIRLLELIDSEGSLSKAAEAMGVSYRRGWLFVQQINAAFLAPAVATPEHGHGGAASRLTPFGRELIARYRALERQAAVEGAGVVTWLEGNQKPS